MSLEYIPVCFVLSFCLVNTAAADEFTISQPEQVHISIADTPWDVTITWVTQNAVNESYVTYGQNRLDQHLKANTTSYVNAGSSTRITYIHSATLRQLDANSSFLYRVGSPHGWSSIFYLRTPPITTDYVHRFIIFGDLGYTNAVSLPLLQREVQDAPCHLVYHLGDVAYDLYENEGRVADGFFNQIESLAAYCPYMVCPGNHEQAFNFSQYKNRFKMPGASDGMFYSFDYGLVHFISIDTEAYYETQYGYGPLIAQHEWLLKDLEKADRNRQSVPWIIVMGHKPMYCTNTDMDDCTLNESVIRTGHPFARKYGLEELFYDYGVDLMFWGHEHSYEREWPVYNRTVYNGTAGAYLNPCAPIHVITGAAGNKWLQNPFGLSAPWTAFRSVDYGYSILEVISAEEAVLKFVKTNNQMIGTVIDNVTIRKRMPRKRYKPEDCQRQ